MRVSEFTGQSDYTPPPEGNHRAVCIAVIDLGTQERDGAYGRTRRREIYIRWELCDEPHANRDGLHTIQKLYNASMNEKANLRKELESWRGAPFTKEDLDKNNPNGFSMQNLLGKACLVQVDHRESGDNVYANVTSVTRLPKSVVAPPPTIEPFILDLNPDRFDAEAWEALTPRLQETICKSPEAKALGLTPRSTAGGSTPADNRGAYERAKNGDYELGRQSLGGRPQTTATPGGVATKERVDTDAGEVFDDEIPF